MRVHSTSIAIASVMGLGACVGTPDPGPPLRVILEVNPPSNGHPPSAQLSQTRDCPIPSEWDLVLWPEMTPVPVRRGASVPISGWYCYMPLEPERSPLAERWYAARFVGVLGDREAPDALLLRDGTRVFRFYGVTHAAVTELAANPLAGHVFLQASIEQAIDPAPGYTWGTMMSATQGSLSCTYPGMDVTIGSTRIGFAESIVLDCTGIDWEQPIHVHIEGAQTRLGDHEPVPVVDLVHTFGAITDSAAFLYLEPPPPLDPPPAPAHLCAGRCD